MVRLSVDVRLIVCPRRFTPARRPVILSVPMWQYVSQLLANCPTLIASLAITVAVPFDLVGAIVGLTIVCGIFGVFCNS